MGCDIHLYVEYKSRAGKDYWNNFGNQMNPGRNYYLFGLLAGVRGSTSLFEPKGLPSNTSYTVESDNKLFITETGNEEHCTTLERAMQWAKAGCEIINGRDGNPTWVTHPDWHSHSWLSLDEYKQAIDAYNSNPKTITYREPEYEAVLAAMQKLSEFDNDVRIVFWFDN